MDNNVYSNVQGLRWSSILSGRVQDVSCARCLTHLQYTTVDLPKHAIRPRSLLSTGTIGTLRRTVHDYTQSAMHVMKHPNIGPIVSGFLSCGGCLSRCQRYPCFLSPHCHYSSAARRHCRHSFATPVLHYRRSFSALYCSPHCPLLSL